MRRKVDPEIFLRAAERIAKKESRWCCYAIFSSSPERLENQYVYSIPENIFFRKICSEAGILTPHEDHWFGDVDIQKNQLKRIKFLKMAYRAAMGNLKNKPKTRKKRKV